MEKGINALDDATIFLTLDANGRYQQVEVAPDDPTTAINWHSRHTMDCSSVHKCRSDRRMLLEPTSESWTSFFLQ